MEAHYEQLPDQPNGWIVKLTEIGAKGEQVIVAQQIYALSPEKGEAHVRDVLVPRAEDNYANGRHLAYVAPTDAELLREAKNGRREEFKNKRDAGIFRRRFNYTQSDGTVIPVDIRNGRDMQNLQALHARAMRILNNGVATSIKFRDADNSIHTLSASEMKALTQEMMDTAEAFYEKSWVHIDHVEGMASVTDVNGYDDTVENGGWPA